MSDFQVGSVVYSPQFGEYGEITKLTDKTATVQFTTAEWADKIVLGLSDIEPESEAHRLRVQCEAVLSRLREESSLRAALKALQEIEQALEEHV